MNMIYSILLIGIGIFLFKSKKIDNNMKTTVVYVFILILMVINLYQENLQLINPNQSYPSFEKDLKKIRNTNYDIYRTKELEVFQSCKDLNGRKIHFERYLVRDKILILKAQNNLKIKELIYNVLLKIFRVKDMVNFNLNFKNFTPEISIFRLSKLERKFLFFKALEVLKRHQVIIFHKPRKLSQIKTLIRQIKKYKRGKLLIFILPSDMSFPLLKNVRMKKINCNDYDKAEFREYLERKKYKFKDFTSNELTELIGNDMKIIDNMFEDQKTFYYKKDLYKFIDKYNLDLQLQGMNKCHITFLKNMLIEFYKINHKTDQIPLDTLIHKNYQCEEALSVKKIINNLIKSRIIQSNGKKVRFFSVVVKNALEKYFKRVH